MSKSTPLRESARGQECFIRIPSHYNDSGTLIKACNYDTETTVLCHDDKSHNFGGKHNDSRASFGCSSCHDIVDGRVQIELSESYIYYYFNEGIKKTQQWWIDNGYLTWKGCKVERKDAQATEFLAGWLKNVAGRFV